MNEKGLEKAISLLNEVASHFVELGYDEWAERIDAFLASRQCETMQRPKSECGCPDCGSSLIDVPAEQAEGAQDELKPCPFCGKPAEERADEPDGRGWFACSNNECPCWHLQAEARDWNNRAALATQPSPAPELTAALRQYRHNNTDDFVFGYDKEETERIVAALRAEIARVKTISDNYFAICVERQRGIDAPSVQLDNLAGANEALYAENGRLAGHLGNLLAVIHRDGGHYKDQHGTAKAVEEAERIVIEQRAQLAELKGQVPEWAPITERLPDVKEGDEQEVIVCVRRAHNGQSYVFSARYLNKYPLHNEYHPEADEDGCILETGWHDVKEHSEYGGWYSPLIEAEGDELTHWMALPAAPKPAAQEGE